ncbi:MAG: linear amide C-N hydrolase [Legionella sp.]|nr:MAG: linear amide C-N hydrolase [Legionella sp.]
MLKRTALFTLIFSLNTFTMSSEASSTLIFSKNTPNTVAANVDWKYREGTVVVHPRDTLMISSVDSHLYHPLIWKSRYGSVIFHSGNRFKPGLAVNGMNEKGLVASVLLLKSSTYPVLYGIPVLNTSEWVRYVLDNYQNVQEVVDDLENYQLQAGTARGVSLNYHLVVNDAEGKSAVIEYLDGKVVVHQQEQLTHLALTNTEYGVATSQINEYKDFGGNLAIPGGYDSISRFIRAAHYLKRLPRFVSKEEHVAYAFNGLSDVAQAPGTVTPTQLSVVFDGPSKTIYFRSINESAVRVIPLENFNFDDLYETLALNVYQHLSGNVSNLFKSTVE